MGNLRIIGVCLVGAQISAMYVQSLILPVYKLILNRFQALWDYDPSGRSRSNHYIISRSTCFSDVLILYISSERLNEDQGLGMCGFVSCLSFQPIFNIGRDYMVGTYNYP